MPSTLYVDATRLDPHSARHVVKGSSGDESHCELRCAWTLAFARASDTFLFALGNTEEENYAGMVAWTSHRRLCAGRVRRGNEGTFWAEFRSVRVRCDFRVHHHRMDSVFIALDWFLAQAAQVLLAIKALSSVFSRVART